MKFLHLTRVYINQTLQTKQTLCLVGEELHYLLNVLRVRKGHQIRLFNKKCGEYLATLGHVDKKNIVVEVEEELRTPLKEKQLTLALCIIKPEPFAESIRSAVQLGVTRIIPVISEYTQLRQIPQARLEKIIQHSVQQSERFVSPTIEEPVKLEDLITSDSIQQLIFVYEACSAQESINNIKKFAPNPCILIGPEGGFSDKEATMIQNHPGAVRVTLGPTVLKTETASSAALACVQMMRGFVDA